MTYYHRRYVGLGEQKFLTENFIKINLVTLPRFCWCFTKQLLVALAELAEVEKAKIKGYFCNVTRVLWILKDPAYLIQAHAMNELLRRGIATRFERILQSPSANIHSATKFTNGYWRSVILIF